MPTAPKSAPKVGLKTRHICRPTLKLTFWSVCPTACRRVMTGDRGLYMTVTYASPD